LTPQGNALWIASKGGNIVSRPLNPISLGQWHDQKVFGKNNSRFPLIEKARVCISQAFSIRITKDIYAVAIKKLASLVVGGEKCNLLHDYYDMRLGSLNPFIGNLVKRVGPSTSEATSRDVQKNWEGLLLRILCLQGGSPDMEVQTIFRLSSVDEELWNLGCVYGGAIAELLHAYWRKCRSIYHTSIGFRLRGSESQISKWRFRVGDTQELAYERCTLIYEAVQFPTGCLDY
jgi:hypothetical protein